MGIAVVVVFPIHDVRIVVVVVFFPVAVQQIRHDAEYRDAKVVDEPVEHGLLIVAEVGTGEIDAKSLNDLVVLLGIDPHARHFGLILCISFQCNSQSHEAHKTGRSIPNPVYLPC